MLRFNVRLACLITIAASVILGNAVAIRGIQAGVNPSTGRRPFRQEFSTFKNSGPAFDLYIQALQRFQQRDQTTLLSYFQVAGIHGVPFRSWDGVGGSNNAGYCTHASTLFPTWHRPYMALYEQVIWSYAQQVAATYPVSKRSRYREAARTLRIPYWDWSINPTMPPEVNSPTIFIITPNGTSNVINPLYNYTFHPQPSDADFPPRVGSVGGIVLTSFQVITDWVVRNLYAHNSPAEPQYRLTTVPYDTPMLLAKASQILQISSCKPMAQHRLHTLTYQLITQQPEYGPFSNIGFSDGRGGRYNSIENMHNAIHMLVGNGGHMSNIPYSSFDPIFWLHHANVDRLFALWQAIYPNASVTPQVNTAGTFTDNPGTTEDINTPLTPFHSDDSGQLWTSATAWSTRTFGYTYPEIVDWGVNGSQLISNVKSLLNALYNPTGSVYRRSESKGTSNELQLSPNAMDAQWFANVRVQKSAATSPFFVHLFLGTAPTDPTTWSFAPNLIGSHSVVDTSLLSSADSNLPATLYGQIPLNHALLAAGNPDLAPSKIVPVLTSLLNWRLQNLDDSPLDISQVPSLNIHVVGQEVKQTAREDQFPEYGPLKVFRQITTGKAGGLNDTDNAD